MISVAEIREGRKLLGWSQMALALEAGVAQSTIINLESGKKTPLQPTLELIQRALESAGVIFVEENGEGPGVRLKKGASAKDAELHHGKSTTRNIRRATND